MICISLSLCGGTSLYGAPFISVTFLFTPVTQSEASREIRSVEGMALYSYVTLSISLDQLLDDKEDMTDRV